jgi:hypothetical protein
VNTSSKKKSLWALTVEFWTGDWIATVAGVGVLFFLLLLASGFLASRGNYFLERAIWRPIRALLETLPEGAVIVLALPLSLATLLGLVFLWLFVSHVTGERPEFGWFLSGTFVGAVLCTIAVG